MAPEAIGVDIIRVVQPPVEVDFYGLSWPTGGRLKVYTYTATGLYIDTVVDLPNPGDADGGYGSNGRSVTRFNRGGIMLDTPDGPIMTLYSKSGSEETDGTLHMISLTDGSIVSYALVEGPGDDTSTTGTFRTRPNSYADREYVWWVQCYLSVTDHSYDLWRASLNEEPAIVGSTTFDTYGAISPHFCPARHGFYSAFCEMYWGGGGTALGVDGKPFGATADAAVFAGYESGSWLDYGTLYDHGLGPSDRQAYAPTFSSDPILPLPVGILTNTTVRSEVPYGHRQCYTQSVSEDLATALFYPWENNASPDGAAKGKLYQPRLGTGNPGADTDEPLILFERPESYYVDAVWIAQHEKTW